MESRPHGRDLQAPIYPLPDGSVEGNPSVNAERGMRIAECTCLTYSPSSFDGGGMGGGGPNRT